MELRYRSNYDFSPSRAHHASTPSSILDNGTTPILSVFSATPTSNRQIQGGVYNNTFANSPNQGGTAASASNWRQSLDRILHHDNRSAIGMKCEEVDRLCASMSNKELIETFPYLLNDIFGFNQSVGWGLNRLEPRMHSTDYRTARHFLSPQGTFFKIIKRLLADQDATFQYPFIGLPAGIVELIEKGNIPMFYANKIVSVSINSTVVHFNSLEYYFVLFAHYVAQQAGPQGSNWSSAEDVLYVQLLEDYLRNFFPLDLSSALTKPVHSDNNPMFKHAKSSSKFSLWKSPEIMSPQTSWGSPSSNAAQTLSDIGKGEIFLQILSDFWLCINKQNKRRDQVYKLPSIDQARVVRVLVKYLHTFTNLMQDRNMQTFSHDATYQAHCTDMKRYTVPALFYKKLYMYLVDCFKHWSLDSSFRMILETWLSFIQPWRYQQSNMSINESHQTDITEWTDFISENLRFYTTLFVMFIKRALRMETRSLPSMHLIFRVVKVYSQSNLLQVLREVLKATPQKNQSLSTTYIINESRGIHTAHRNSWELPNDEMTIFGNDTAVLLHDKSGWTSEIYPVSELPSLFHGYMLYHGELFSVLMIQSLCENLAKACVETRSDILKSTSIRQTGKSKSFLTRLRDFFMLEENYEQAYLHQEERLIDYLEQSCFVLSQMYELPAFDTQPKCCDTVETSGSVYGNLPKPELNKQDENDDGVTPDFVMTEDGVKLTDFGREQILRRQRHFEFCYSGDPELQPVRSFESKFLVYTMYEIAMKINSKYGRQLYSLYNRNDFVSNTLRKLSREVENTRFMNCPIKIPRSRVDLSEVHPRISFRFVGSYYFMGYLFWMVVFTRLFGLSWFGIFVFLLLALFLSVIYHIDSPPKIMQNEMR